MSVVSSRSTATTISSILKGKTASSNVTSNRNRVNFQLPKNLKNILLNYQSPIERKSYENLIGTLRDANIKDNEFVELLQEVRPCISLLGNDHTFLVNALVKINWTDRGEEATDAYKAFLEDLVCVHSYHCKLVIDQLICLFKVSDEDKEWEDGKPREQDIIKLNHVHNVIFKFLKIVPMSSTILVQSLRTLYPYYKKSAHSHQVYLYFSLQIMEYAPQLRSEIISTIIEKLTILDVNVPRTEIENYREKDEDEEVFKIDSVQETDKADSDHPLAHTLDICMDILMTYIYEYCHPDDELDQDNLKKIYFELLQPFEKVVLHTHASHHVQFIMFYICSFKTAVAEAFLNWLWQKVSNPNVAPIIRQSAVSYIASLLARGNFIPITLITGLLQDMTNWIHSYIAAQDSLESANSDVRAHTVFYSVCQAVFYIVGFRSRELVSTRKNLLFLQGLNFTKIISCRLNPLRVCLPVVVQHFAAVTRTYQLAYCYSIMEHNSRSNLPVLQTTNRFVKWLDTFFPFDPYVLIRSSQKIDPIYLHYQGSSVDLNPSLSTTDSNDQENDEDDDFMDVSYPQDSLNYHRDKFSYSSSPGFIHA
ncbi:RNA polymerase I-specific transcription initiation factor RRN3 [Microplitis mediator]|uniref:RNA polymerase I-specific transcription initiation factor RRN3 n=1 Tax=Microplitis mediator TaxID=375433 RepID=UPI0025529DDE|nr:RNA polymerase I-specific transcription initiation factor RRN3 [Microplitis mediator]